MQFLGLFLESLILINLQAALEPQESRSGAANARTPVLVALVLLVSPPHWNTKQLLSNNVLVRLLLFLSLQVVSLHSSHIRGDGYGCSLQARFTGGP